MPGQDRATVLDNGPSIGLTNAPVRWLRVTASVGVGNYDIGLLEYILEHHHHRYARRDDDRRRSRRGEIDFRPLEVPVIDGNLEGAIRALKRKLSKDL